MKRSKSSEIDKGQSKVTKYFSKPQNVSSAAPSTSIDEHPVEKQKSPESVSLAQGDAQCSDVVPINPPTFESGSAHLEQSIADHPDSNAASVSPPILEPESKSTHPTTFDIALHKTTVDDKQKLFLLKNNWLVPTSFVFPLRKIRGVNRAFTRSWLEKFPWLRYSQSEDGLYCLYCVLFNSDEHAFVRDPVNDWANLGTLIKRHLKQSGHGNCVEKSENFVAVAEGKKEDVISMLSTSFQHKISRNRDILKSILKTIYLCGKQNIPLRGHTEDKSNFIALIKFRAETDKILADHLQNSPPNARYLSPQIQNELISICGDQIQRRIVQECNAANCFSIIADETTDVSTIEQVALCLRYVDTDTDGVLKVKEGFVGFAEASSTTGEALAATIMGKLNEYGIVTQAMRGQGYDGAANMAGKLSGVRTRIQAEIPEAHYVHCYAHCLNLAVVKSCQLPIIRNAVDIVKDVSFAFSYSSKRTGRFKTMLEQADAEQREVLDGRRKIKGMCETRWSSRADALNTFKSAHSIIVDTLDDLATDGDKNAKQLKLAIQDFGFMVALIVAEHVLQYSLALSNLLQRPTLDLVEAASEAKTVVESFRRIRQDDNIWQQLYTEILTLARKQDVQPSKPRTAGRQQHRTNTPADTPEQYWRRSLFYPLLDHMANEIEERIIVPKDRFLAQYLIPSRLNLLTPDMEASVFAPFAADLSEGKLATSRTELVRWRCKWDNINEKPRSLIETLQHANPELYPNIHTAVKILLSMPVTSATAERSFSALKRVKTYLRSTMVEDRLNGLSLMHVHPEIQIDFDEAINTFASDGNRKIHLLFPY